MRVLIKEPGKDPRRIFIPNQLDVMQQLVGGYIEHIHYSEGVGIICDEEGKLKGKDRNFFFKDDVIVGTVLFVGDDDDMYFTDIPENAVKEIMNRMSARRK